MDATWLYDTVTQLWHLWNKLNPTNGDTALCGHVMDSNCSGMTFASPVPLKCATCVANGITAGLPIN